MNRLGLLTAVVLALASIPVEGHATTTPPDPVTWGIVPSGPDGPGDRAAFEYALDPGATLTDTVAVTNYTAEPLTLEVYASDAVRSTLGGFDLLPADDTPTEVGSWVDLGEPTVIVPARSRVDIPFRLTVPDDATPGDHAGGIVAVMTSPATGDATSQVTVDRRVGARLYVRISGTLRPTLTIDDVRPSFDGVPAGQPGTVSVDYTVRNDGNLRLGGRPEVRVTGPFGIGERHWVGDRVPELLPGDSISGTAVVEGVWQLGRLDVEVTIQPESSGDQVLDPAPEPGQRTEQMWVVPWILLAVLGAAAAGLVRYRRRSRTDADADDTARVQHA